MDMSETNNYIFLQFEESGALPTIIKVLGVGGGSNAVITCLRRESQALIL